MYCYRVVEYELKLGGISIIIRLSGLGLYVTWMYRIDHEYQPERVTYQLMAGRLRVKRPHTRRRCVDTFAND